MTGATMRWLSKGAQGLPGPIRTTAIPQRPPSRTIKPPPTYRWCCWLSRPASALRPLVPPVGAHP